MSPCPDSHFAWPGLEFPGHIGILELTGWGEQTLKKKIKTNPKTSLQIWESLPEEWRQEKGRKDRGDKMHFAARHLESRRVPNAAAATFSARPRPLLSPYPEAAGGGGSSGGGASLSLRSWLRGGVWGGRSWPQ